MNALRSEDRLLLLDAATALFLRRNVCFRENFGNGETLLVFPSLINVKRPQTPTEVEEDITYLVRGAIENLYAALVVLLGYTNTFLRTNQWQYHAEYEFTDASLCGFRQFAPNEGAIEFVLYYSKATPAPARTLFQGLFEMFLHGRDILITRYMPIKCDHCGERQDRGAVIRQASKGARKQFCYSCGAPLQVPHVMEIDGLEWRDQKRVIVSERLSVLRTQFEAALVRLKSFLRDRGPTPQPTVFISYAWGNADHGKVVKRLVSDLSNADVDVVYDNWHNALPGAGIDKFVERMENAKFIIAVGTPPYLEKYKKHLDSGLSVVGGEITIINQRLLRNDAQRSTVLPVLLDGSPETSFPLLLRGQVYSDLRSEPGYFIALFDLLLKLYDVGAAHEVIREQRERLQRATEDFISANYGREID